jgi:hypothetical protein
MEVVFLNDDFQIKSMLLKNPIKHPLYLQKILLMDLSKQKRALTNR